MLKLYACMALAAIFAVAAADFPLAAWAEDEKPQRVWYGDGNLYIGAAIPNDVQLALNFTILEPRNNNFDFWFINPLLDGALVFTDGPLPFLAIHPAETGSPVFFTEDVAKYAGTKDVAYTWLHYQSMAIPVEQDGKPIDGKVYLKDTSTAGTSQLVFDPTEKGEGLGKGVNLLTTTGDKEEDARR